MVVRNVVEVYSQPTSETLELIMDDGRTVDIKVNLCKIALDDFNQLVYVYDSSQSNLARGVEVFEPNFYVLNFANITTPAEADANALYSTLLGYLDEISGGGGDATAANQVIEIARLTSILAQLDITQTALANLIKGGSTLNDVVANVSGVYSATNALSSRVIAANCTSGTQSNAVLATLVTNTNTTIQASGTHLIGVITYVFDGLLWNSFYTTSTA